jgi:ParB-like chromosome segregation protein Spo0J
LNIEWHNEKRKIKDLIPYVANPRQITEKQAQDLKASLERFGVADPIIINTDNTIIGGHQRKKILETLMNTDPDFEIDVRVPDRELSIDEARELNVRLNKNVAEWNFDTLANNFELDDLLDWGFEKSELDLEMYYAPKFDEYDESIADDVEMIECPNCGHHFPK